MQCICWSSPRYKKLCFVSSHFADWTVLPACTLCIFSWSFSDSLGLTHSCVTQSHTEPAWENPVEQFLMSLSGFSSRVRLWTDATWHVGGRGCFPDWDPLLAPPPAPPFPSTHIHTHVYTRHTPHAHCGGIKAHAADDFDRQTSEREGNNDLKGTQCRVLTSLHPHHSVMPPQHPHRHLVIPPFTTSTNTTLRHR